MGKQFPRMAEDGVAYYAVYTIYLLQDTLHETTPLLAGRKCGLDFAFNAVQVAVRFDRNA